MNEEIKFLREHIKDICSYKGLQEELTYDVSLDILKRVCIALDYLQQENKQLKDYKNKWEALKLAIIGNFNKTQNTIYLDILTNIIEPIERADNNDK